MEIIFEENERFSIDKTNDADASIKVITVDKYVIVDRMVKAGHWQTGGFEPKWEWMPEWTLRDSVSILKNYSSPSENIHFAVQEADEWFAKVEHYISNFTQPKAASG